MRNQLRSTTGTGGSDYSAFIKRGIEALGLMTSGGTGHPDYHQSGDDVDKIDPKILGQTGQFVLQGVMNLANETQSNLLVADRQHIYDAERLTVTDMRGGPSPAAGRGGAQGGGRGGGGGWSNVAATNSGELISLADDRAKQLVQAQQTAAAAAPGGRGGGGGNLSKLAPARGTGGGF